jgi:hypothetical protein
MTLDRYRVFGLRDYFIRWCIVSLFFKFGGMIPILTLVLIISLW